MEFSKQANQNVYPFILPDLPYKLEALQPYISSETMEYHHKKHHLTYVNNLNNLLKDHQLKKNTLEEIIQISFEKGLNSIFNNASQVWNHSFFWHCLTHDQKNIDYPLIDQIKEDFGSLKDFAIEFKDCGTTQFGSGWVWLIKENDKLKLIKTSNADSPIIQNIRPILTCDVWEHAYYIDYRNKRVEYLDIFTEKLINWEFANNNFLKN